MKPLNAGRTTQTITMHQGRKVKRFRGMLRIKQSALAFELGEDWMQKKISLLRFNLKIIAIPKNCWVSKSSKPGFTIRKHRLS